MPELTGQTDFLFDLYWWLTARPWWHAFSEAILTPLWRWALNDRPVEANAGPGGAQGTPDAPAAGQTTL